MPPILKLLNIIRAKIESGPWNYSILFGFLLGPLSWSVQMSFRTEIPLPF